MARQAPSDPPAHFRPDASLSFPEFYRSEYGAAVRLAFVLTGRADVAEEIVQDAFVAAHRRWDQVAVYDRPGAWLRRVVTNRCISATRRGATEVRLVARLRRQRPPEPALAAPDRELWEAVRALPGRQAQVVALVFVEDRSVAEVAEVLGCGEATVRTHLRRGRLALARRLGQPWEQGEDA